MDPNPYPDPAPHQGDANLRPLAYKPPKVSILSLHAYILSFHTPQPPGLYFEPRKSLNVYPNADQDTAFHPIANPDPALSFQKQCGSGYGSETLPVAI